MAKPTKPPTASAAAQPQFTIYRALGTSGLKRAAGRVSEEWKAQLRGDLGPKKFREMADNDPSVRLGLTMLTLMQQRPRYRVRTPDATDQQCVEMANLLETALEDMEHSFQDIMEQADSQNIFGWAAFELTYKRRRGMRPGTDENGNPTPVSRYSDGRIGWAGWSLRAQETRDSWDITPAGEIVALRQSDPTAGTRATIPLRDPATGMQKLLLFRTDTTKNNPEGRSLCRSIHTAYEHKKHHMQFEGIRAQKDVTGVLDIQAPPQAWSDPNMVSIRQDIEAQAAQYSLTERVFFMRPSEDQPGSTGGKTGWKLGVVPSAGATVIDHDRVIRRCDGAILMAFFAEIAAMGTAGESSGSMALGGVKKEITTLACEALNRKKESVINRDAVPSLMLLNGRDDPSKWPWVEFEPVQPQDPWKILDSAVKLMQVGGLTATHDVEQRNRELLGYNPLPELDATGDGTGLPGVGAAQVGAPGMPGTDGSVVPSAAAQEAQTNAGITLEYLSRILERARASGDNDLAEVIAAKLKEKLAAL